MAGCKKRKYLSLVLIESAILFQRFRDNVVEKMILKHFVCIMFAFAGWCCSFKLCLINPLPSVCYFLLSLQWCYLPVSFHLFLLALFIIIREMSSASFPAASFSLFASLQASPMSFSRKANLLNDDDSEKFPFDDSERKAISTVSWNAKQKFNKNSFRFVYF